MTIPLISHVPSRTQDQDTFDTNVEGFVDEVAAMIPYINEDVATVNSQYTGTVSAANAAGVSEDNAAASAASASMSAALAGSLVAATSWVSGTVYAVGAIRTSPANSRLYKCISITTSGDVTDPSSDTTHWMPALFDSLVGDARFAAISASLPALSYVASCFHLEADDTVKWRKRKGQSWRSEARSPGKYLGVYANATAAVAAGGATGDVFYSTGAAAFHEITGATTSSVTYRAGKEDYPTNALITAEAARVIIWDLDGAVPSMWMVFVNSSIVSTTMLGRSTTVVSSIVAKDSSIVFGHNSGTNLFAAQIIFAADTAYAWVVAGNYVGTVKIADRNTAGLHYQLLIGTGIVNAIVNSVAITVLPDAPVDEYGMPIDTKIVGTAAGGSQIGSNGVVWDATGAIAIVSCDINTRGESVYAAADKVYIFNALLTADTALTSASYILDVAGTTEPHIHGTVDTVKWAGDDLLIGTSTGLFVLRYNRATPASSLLSTATSTYTTGQTVGATIGAWLANSATADRSVKANTLTEVGTVTVGTTLAVNDFSGWAAGVHVYRASDADWDTLGTGSVCMMGWFNCTGNSAVESLMGFANAGNTVRCLVTLTAAGLLECIDDGATAAVTTATTSALDNSAWHHFAFVRTSSTSRALYVDGRLITSNTTDAGSITDTGNLPFAIGIDPDLTNTPATTTSLALLRMGATAPTAEQIKHIYATEAPLFVAGNTCLLSNSNKVSTLTYNEVTGCYEVGNGTNVDTFSGLQRIASQAHGVTTLKSIASSGPYKLIAGTGATFTADERNVKSELSETSKAKRTQNYSFTSSGTTWALPQGWKAQGVLFNLTDGTMAAVTQTFDGFLWTMSGLTTAKAHQVQLVEV